MNLEIVKPIIPDLSAGIQLRWDAPEVASPTFKYQLTFYPGNSASAVPLTETVIASDRVAVDDGKATHTISQADLVALDCSGSPCAGGRWACGCATWGLHGSSLRSGECMPGCPAGLRRQLRPHAA